MDKLFSSRRDDKLWCRPRLTLKTFNRSLKNRSYRRHLENIWVRTAKPIETLFCLFLFPTLVPIYILSSSSISFIYSLSKSHLVAPELLWFQSCLFTWCLWHDGKHVGKMLKNGNLLGDFKAAKIQWHFVGYLVVAYCFHPWASYTHKEGGKDKYLQDHRKWKRRTHRTGSYRNIGRNNKRTGGKLVARVIVATCVCVCVCFLQSKAKPVLNKQSSRPRRTRFRVRLLSVSVLKTPFRLIQQNQDI